MSRYIDADAIPYITPLRETIAYKEDIDKMPTIDAVEVVRCKDCVFGELDNRAEMYRCRLVSFPHWNKGEHFCSYGEKETDHE